MPAAADVDLCFHDGCDPASGTSADDAVGVVDDPSPCGLEASPAAPSP